VRHHVRECAIKANAGATACVETGSVLQKPRST